MMTTSGFPINSHLAQSEVREVLQYVPIFTGKTFLVVLSSELPDTVLAETLLDLISLQRIGVKLVVAYEGEKADNLLDRAAEVELKLSVAEASSVERVLTRGQAALVPGVSELVPLSLTVKADKILYLGDPLDFPKEWQGALNLESAQSALSGAAHWALDAVQQGVKRVHLLQAEMPGCLSRELFSNEGVGVMIYADSYLEIRPITEEDIPELLAIIGLSMRVQHLLPRTYEEVVAQIQDYSVMSIDGNVVGSVAVYAYDEADCELACLFVKETHKGLGYGHDLVKYAEAQAVQRGFSKIFALSTDAGGFFEQKMGYQEVSLDTLPPARKEKLLKSGRNSIALMKIL